MRDFSPKVFISVSSNPGRFGEIVHNAGYRYHKLNYIYKAIKIKNIKSIIDSIKLLNISGCSVSMPFKEEVVMYLDRIDHLAKKVGAINTILNKDGKLIGYNTDVYGAINALSLIKIKKTDTVFIIGAGGVAKAIIVALNKIGVKKIFITNRGSKKIKSIKKKFKCDFIDWNDRNKFNANILINATPVGMKKDDQKTPIVKSAINNFDKVMDVIVKNSDTALIKEAKKLKLLNVDGLVMTLYQAAKQYEIYTDLKAPISILTKAYKNNF